MNRHVVRRPVDGNGKWSKQTPRTIRLHGRDWERIEIFAVMRGMSVTELIRATVLSALGEEPAPTDSGGRLAPQIEQMFRYTHTLATALRSEMLKNGRGDELEELIRSARELQSELSECPAARSDQASGEQGAPGLMRGRCNTAAAATGNPSALLPGAVPASTGSGRKRGRNGPGLQPVERNSSAIECLSMPGSGADLEQIGRGLPASEAVRHVCSRAYGVCSGAYRQQNSSTYRALGVCSRAFTSPSQPRRRQAPQVPVRARKSAYARARS